MDSAAVWLLRSAAAKNSCGAIGPSSGWCQRASISTECMSPVARSTIGWTTTAKLVALHGVAQVGGQADAVQRLGHEVRREDPDTAGAGLRGVHREVRGAQQVRRGRRVPRRERDAERPARRAAGCRRPRRRSSNALSSRPASARAATSSAQPGATTANSSPPSRATTASSPIAVTKRPASTRSSSSPAWWPRVSLTALKPLKSRTMTANGICRRRVGRLLQQRAEAEPVRQAGELVGAGLEVQALDEAPVAQRDAAVVRDGLEQAAVGVVRTCGRPRCGRRPGGGR